MALAGYTTTWVPKAKVTASMLGQHRRVFPGNVLGDYAGYVKVAVKDGEAKSKDATLTKPVAPVEVIGGK